MFSWDLTLFHREIENLIQIIELPETRGPAAPGHLPPGPDCTLGGAAGCYFSFDNNGSSVTAEGGEFTVTAQLTESVSATFDWTHSDTKEDGAGAQIDNTPEDTAKLILDWAPMDMPLGAGLSINYVGDEVGRGLAYGNDTVIDLNARWYLDKDRKQRIGVRVENVTDEEYFTSFGRGITDVGATPYTYPNLGRERSYFINYAVNF